jgi:hypothetical protein
METIKHLLGLCGESHLNLIQITLLILFTYVVCYLARSIRLRRSN